MFFFKIRTGALFIQEVSGVYTSPFLDTDELKMALRARKVSGASRNGPQVSFAAVVWCRHAMLPAEYCVA